MMKIDKIVKDCIKTLNIKFFDIKNIKSKLIKANSKKLEGRYGDEDWTEVIIPINLSKLFFTDEVKIKDTDIKKVVFERDFIIGIEDFCDLLERHFKVIRESNCFGIHNNKICYCVSIL